MKITNNLPLPVTPNDGSRPSAQSSRVGDTFKAALDRLNESQQTSDDLISMLAAGEDVDVHQVMLAVEETDVNFRISMAIRDRLVEAYREVMRMAV